MKKYLLLIVTLLFAATAFPQKLYFAKTNYTDSAQLEKNIPDLAKQVLARFSAKSKPNYYDTLFRVQIVARQYALVPNSLKNLGLYAYGDTISTKDVGFNFKVYAIAMQQNLASKAAFAKAYERNFMALYNDMIRSCKTAVEGLPDADIPGLKKRLDAKLKSLSTSDSISLHDAILLCRSYCVYTSTAATQTLMRKILNQIEKDTYIINDSVLVKMPDGGTISMTIVRDRKATAPLPVVLKYSIYPNPNDVTICKDIEQHGYVGIVVNVRGKRLSPDVIEPFEHDAQDAYYIIDWISKQPWCNGKVGMYGGSYVGFTQWAAVKHLHPALKTIVPQVAVAPGIDFPIHNGILLNYDLRWLHYTMDKKMLDVEGFRDEKKWADLYTKWYTTGTSSRGMDSLEGRPSKQFQRHLQHPSYDSYWQSMTPQKAEFAKLNIPVLTMTGYYDDEQIGAMYYYHAHHKYNKNANHYLLIGPYDHYGAQSDPKPELAGYKLDSVAVFPMVDVVFGWFDHFLKGKPLPAILKDKVNFEIMGQNKWGHAPTLAKMSNDTLKFYLGNTILGKQSRYPLLAAKPIKLGYISHKVDLTDRRDPMPAGEDDVISYRSLVDTVLKPHPEQLVFISQPIDKPFAISGAIKASILASINKKDMDLLVNLLERTPDGKYIPLSANIQRASYAKTNTKRQLLTPGKPTLISINDNYLTSRQLQKGSRIVIILGINKSPDWQINYGTGKDVADESIKDAAIPMDIKWYNSSWIKIPILRQ